MDGVLIAVPCSVPRAALRMIVSGRTIEDTENMEVESDRRARLVASRAVGAHE